MEISFDEFSAQQYRWFNKQIRSKSKQYFYYQDWFEKGIYSISDLIDVVDPNNIRIKTFEDLVFDFQISEKNRKKYNFLLKYIPSIWFDFPGIQTDDIYQRIIDNLIFAGKNCKIPKHSYSQGFQLLGMSWREKHRARNARTHKRGLGPPMGPGAKPLTGVQGSAPLCKKICRPFLVRKIV